LFSCFGFRKLFFSNDCFYFLVYGEIHWEILIYTSDIQKLIKRINVSVTTDYEIDKFIVSDDGQIVIEFKNVVKIYSQNEWRYFSTESGRIKHIFYKNNRFYFLLRKNSNYFQIVNYSNDWKLIGIQNIPEIKQSYGMAKLFLIDNVFYLLIKLDNNFNCLYELEFNLEPGNRLKFDSDKICVPGNKLFYLIDKENKTIEKFIPDGFIRTKTFNIDLVENMHTIFTYDSDNLYIIRKTRQENIKEIKIYPLE